MDTIAIRTASSSDVDALTRLAALDEAPVPAGRVLVATIAGELSAAVAVETGESIADPFVPTADAVALLRAHARRLRAEPGARPLAARLGLRHRPLARAA
jgi:hypothetical protein